MSMIGKLRQVSEFELARYKKNPADLVRALVGAPHSLHPLLNPDPQFYAQLREAMLQSPAMQRMAELAKNHQMPTREEQLAAQQEMMKLAQGLRQGSSGQPPPAQQSPATPAAQPSNELDLHKSWHCLHFLFTGKAEGGDGTPLGDAILGGDEIGGDAADTGYGPPRALSPAKVRAVAAALAEFPIDQKTQSFDVKAADNAGVYVPQHEPAELKEYFTQLREFYQDAAGKGNAVLLWIA